MSNNYVPNESDLLPGELARSADINLRYSNVVAGFDLLPAPLGSGQTGFSAACNVGTPTADAHAVTKLYATTTIVTAAEAAALVYIQPTLAAHLAATTVLRDEAAASATASANSAAASQTSRVAAETAETNAETAETNAETAEAGSVAAKNASQTSASASATSATAAAAGAADVLANKNAAAVSATNSAASAVTSNTAKTAALAAQAAAETAETNAEAAESNVVGSASAAATSAASALTSKNSATASATSATSSASSASGSSGTASTKASEASTSAADALSSKNAAATSATTATNQAAISTTKAGEASTSATSAATSSSTATSQAGIATTKAGESASSATAAASSASAAAASFDQFDDIYLGAKSSAPTVDNDGNALATGALYFNTASNTMFVYSGSTWAAAGSAVNGTSERQEYTATSGQTSFNATYDVGFVDVYLNGSRLVPATDFTASNGATVVLTTGATTGDNVGIIAYGAFNVADVYTQAQSNARFLQISNNLSDLASAPTALTNLGLTATAAELNYTDGVTSNIQTQLNAAGAGSVTSVNVAGGATGLTASGGPITGSGVITLGGTLAAASGGTGITAAGTSGNVLTSTGSGWASTAPAAGGTSGMQFLQTVTASGASTVDIGSSSLFSSTYDAYVIIGTNLTFSTNNNHFRGSLFQAASGMQTSGYATVTSYFKSSGTSTGLEYTNSGGYIMFARSGVVNASYANGQIEIHFSEPDLAGTHKIIQHTYTGVGSSEGPNESSYSTGVSSVIGTTDALTKLRIYPASGTMGGVFRLYGVAKS